MNCWHCDTELIWGGDHDISDDNEDYQMVTNLSCPNCECLVEVYLPTPQKLRVIDLHYPKYNLYE